MHELHLCGHPRQVLKHARDGEPLPAGLGPQALGKINVLSPDALKSLRDQGLKGGSWASHL